MYERVCASSNDEHHQFTLYCIYTPDEFVSLHQLSDVTVLYTLLKGPLIS